MGYLHVTVTLCIVCITTTLSIFPKHTVTDEYYDKYDSNSSKDYAKIIEQGYEYWCTGSCDSFSNNTTTHAGIILMGGTNVDDAFRQQINWSDCGDFLVIRASGNNSFNSYIYDLGCARSVRTIVINNRTGANDPFVINVINNSDAIFFSGGDQGKYIQDWMDTDLQTAVQTALDRNIPIGGTSGGAMIQCQYIYTINGGVTSNEALENPYNSQMIFSENFITQKYNLLANTIMDPHFQKRDRFGRLLTFVGRLRQDSNDTNNIIGIGVNEGASIVIDCATSIGTVMGSNNTFIILPGRNNPQVCQPNTPLTYQNVTIQKLESKYNDKFNFWNWTGGQPNLQYEISANNGELSKTNPYDPATFIELSK